MDRNERWLTLIPGFSQDYFSLRNQPQVQPEPKAEYSPANALLLAELSRWVYNADKEDIRTHPAEIPHHNPYLHIAKLEEVQLFALDSAQASIVRTLDKSCHILVFRGTSKMQDWMANLSASAKRWGTQGMVHQGFMESFTPLWEQLEPVLKKIDTPILYTGHSLGAAHATLAASLLPPTVLYTYGSPRVGDEEFASRLKDVQAFRIVNGQDIVPALPVAGKPLHYVHVGQLVHFGRSLRWKLYRLMINIRYAFRKKKFVTEIFPKLENPFYPPPFLLDHAPYFYVRRLIHKYRHTKDDGKEDVFDPEG